MEAGQTGRGDFSGAKVVEAATVTTSGQVLEWDPLTCWTHVSVPTHSGSVGDGPFSHTTGAMVLMVAV